MKWTDSLLNGTIVLNQRAVQVKGRQLSATVHYWGAQSSHYNNKPHRHSFFEICYILDGTGTYKENEAEYVIDKQALFLSRPYKTHQILSDTGLDIIFVGFEINKEDSGAECRSLFAALEKTEKIFIRQAARLPVIPLWLSLLQMANGQPPLFEDGITGLCCSLFAGLERIFNDRHTVRSNDHASSAAANLVYQAKLYIRDNLNQSLKLYDLADHLHISARHLSRIFLAELGQSYSGYVRKERIRNAGILLSETDLTVKEISEKTGFDNVHYFTSVFSKEMGMPPGKFKKKFRQQLD